jgi:hypothetical protein
MGTIRVDLSPIRAEVHVQGDSKLDELLTASRSYGETRAGWVALLALTGFTLIWMLLSTVLEVDSKTILLVTMTNILINAAFQQWRVFYTRNRFNRIKTEWLKEAGDKDWQTPIEVKHDED